MVVKDPNLRGEMVVKKGKVASQTQENKLNRHFQEIRSNVKGNKTTAVFKLDTFHKFLPHMPRIIDFIENGFLGFKPKIDHYH